MGAFCCHGNQSFDPIYPKTLCSLFPTPVMLHIKFDQDWPTCFRDIQVWKCGRRTTDDGSLVYYKRTYLSIHSAASAHEDYVQLRASEKAKCGRRNGWGYTHDRRADKYPYPHDRRADKDFYPHDRRADKDSHPHDRNVTDDLCSLIKLCFAFIMVNFSS